MARISERDLRFTLERGAYRALTRMFRVSDLTWPDPKTSVAISALAVVDGSVTIPQKGDTLAAYPNLVCADHDVKVVEKSSRATVCVVDVDAHYLPIAEAGIEPYFDVEPSLVTETVQLDVFNRPMYVGYLTEEGFDVQVGTAPKLFPSVSLKATFLHQDAFIDRTVGSWFGRANSRTWRSQAVQHWLCFNFKPTIWDVSTDPWTYSVDVEFVYKTGGWRTDVWYVDARGSIPGDIISGVGARTFQIYGARAYQDLFEG